MIIFCGVIVFIYPLASNISLRDYKVPVSSARSSFVSGMLYLQDREDSIPIGGVGTFAFDFNKFYSSLPFAYDITFHLRTDAQYPERFEINDTTMREDTFSTHSVYTVQLSGQMNKYLFKGKDFFGFTKLDYTQQTVYYQPDIEIIGGFGIGRFINATPLARAIRIEEELKKEGVLVGDIPYGVLLKFAKHLAPEVQKKYQEEFYYWEREYYATLEEILKSSGVLKNQELGSTGTLVINDIMNEFIAERYYGTEFALGIGYEISNPAQYDTIHDVFIEFAEKFATPLDIKSQFIQSFSLQFPFTGGKLGNELSSSFMIKFSYEVSNKIDFVGAYYLNATIQREGGRIYHEHEGDITFIYTIINRLDLTNTISVRRPSGIERFDWEFRTELKYRIL